MEKAVKECINNGILKDYLLRKGNEVINMLMAEYSYETDIKVQREEAAEEAAAEANKRAAESEKKAEDANRRTIELIENAAKDLQLSIKDTCDRFGASYDEYLRIKETL